MGDQSEDQVTMLESRGKVERSADISNNMQLPWVEPVLFQSLHQRKGVWKSHLWVVPADGGAWVGEPGLLA